VSRARRAKPPPKRQTQAERRALTIRRLTDATVQSLLEVGYARTTVKEICRRAKLSDGALFRFFPTLLDLILAAAEAVARRQIAVFESRFAAANDGTEPPMVTALTVLREVCRSRTNIAFTELLVAARTDPALRRRLAPGIEAYQAAIRQSADRVPGVRDLSPELRDAVVFGATHLFDREAMLHYVYPRPEEDEIRLVLAKRFAALLGAP